MDVQHCARMNIVRGAVQNKLRKERELRQQAQASMQVLSKTQKSRERLVSCGAKKTFDFVLTLLNKKRLNGNNCLIVYNLHPFSAYVSWQDFVNFCVNFLKLEVCWYISSMIRSVFKLCIFKRAKILHFF